MLIETLPAAFQMDEILYELRDHSYGLNAGRWDYIFSMIKCFRDRPEFVLPDRTDVKMTVPFMHAYTELLVQTCHKRGAFAMGGMAAQIPSRKDEEANERGARRRARPTRSARPRPASTAPGSRTPTSSSTRRGRLRRGARRQAQPDRQAAPRRLRRRPSSCSTPASTPGEITEEGLRNDVSVGFQYISFWLGGRGAAGINNLMEDAATAEISRSQIWQWVRTASSPREHVARGRSTRRWQKIRAEVGEETWQKGRPDETREIFERVALGDEFPDFLTLPAYDTWTEPLRAAVREPGGSRDVMLARGPASSSGARRAQPSTARSSCASASRARRGLLRRRDPRRRGVAARPRLRARSLDAWARPVPGATSD